jgi:UrcA family protein
MKTLTRIQLVARCVSLALIGGALLNPQAFAAEPASTTVKYSDLNLQTPAGVQALYKRIHNAAQQVCDSGGDRNLSILSFDRKCAASAENAAIKQVHNEALSAYYQTKIGRPNALVAMSDGK